MRRISRKGGETSNWTAEDTRGTGLEGAPESVPRLWAMDGTAARMANARADLARKWAVMNPPLSGDTSTGTANLHQEGLDAKLEQELRGRALQNMERRGLRLRLEPWEC